MPDMGKMLGPLPLGAWLAVVGGGLGFALYTRRQASGVTMPIAMDSTTPQQGVGEGGSGMWTDLTPPAPVASTDLAIETNEQWGVAAVNWLIGMGYQPNTADTAIRKYLVGAKMSPQEYVLVGLALGHLHSPPELLPPSDNKPPVIPSGTPPRTVPPPKTPPKRLPRPRNPGPKAPKLPPRKPKTKPKPKPKAPAPRPRVRYYVVRPGDSLSKIAQHYYHKPDWQRIYNANKSRISNPNLIRAGQRLVIP